MMIPIGYDRARIVAASLGNHVSVVKSATEHSSKVPENASSDVSTNFCDAIH